jgi:hypothetical protein
MVLKIKLPPSAHLSKAALKGLPIPSIQETEGFAHLYLPALPREVLELRYEFGEHLPDSTILNQGSYLVTGRSPEGDCLRFDLRMFGEQEVEVTTAAKPRAVTCSNARLQVLGVRFNAEARTTSITLKAHDIQGESGELILAF